MAHEQSRILGSSDPNLQQPERMRQEDGAPRSTLDEEQAVLTMGMKPPRDVAGWQWALAVAAILSSVFLFSLDQTIVADIIPPIVQHFGEIDKLPWISVTLLLAAAGTINFWAKMFDQFDPKWLYIICVGGFEVGSAVCGAAPSMNAIIVGRAIAGLAGAGMYLGVVMLLSVFTTPTERPAYFGMLGATFGLGTVLGPIVGGAFADSSATWRWAFYINLCIGGLFGPIYFLYLPSRDPRPGAGFLARLREIDWVGTVLQTGAFTSGIMAVSFGGVYFLWDSGKTIGLFVCSGILFIMLGLQQALPLLTTKGRRVFPVQYVTSKEMVILFCQIAAASTNSFIAIYFIPIYFQFVQSDQALRAGVRLLPYIIPLVAATMANGILMEKLLYYMPWFLSGGLLIIASNAMLYHITLATHSSYIYGALVLGGIGTGLFVNAPFAIAQWLVPESELAQAVGFITCAQVAGVTISLAIGNAVFLNLAQNSITRLLPDVPRSAVQAAISGVGGTFLKTLHLDLQTAVLQAIIDALARVFILGIAAGCLAVILSIFMSREKINLNSTPLTSAAETASPQSESDLKNTS
ncbi:MAG: hypothetical protein M1816_002418 [Peltula sp. TS41687]|nr:MAG: hypothetical protein M1816_002418 [Peltula sp. TS41687]